MFLPKSQFWGFRLLRSVVCVQSVYELLCQLGNRKLGQFIEKICENIAYKTFSDISCFYRQITSESVMLTKDIRNLTKGFPAKSLAFK